MRVSIVLLLLWLAAAIAPCAAADRSEAASTSPEAAPGVLWLARARLREAIPPASAQRPRFQSLRLAPELELATGPHGMALQPTQDAGDPASSPSARTTRWRVRIDDAAPTPATAMLDTLGADSLSPARRTGTGRHWAHLDLAWPLAQRAALTLQPGVSVSRNAQGRRRPEGVLTMALRPLLAPDWQGSVAVVGRTANAASTGSAPLSLDGGIGWRTSNTWRLDLAVSRRLAGTTTPLQGGFIVSAHF